MLTAETYVDAVGERLHEIDRDFAMLPTILSEACVDAMPIAGAGLSLMGDLRLPLGASDAHAALVERLQISLGSGPCMSAAATGEPSVSDEGVMAVSWPAFHSELVANTPYRSVMSLPAKLAGFVGALNLYSTDPAGLGFPSVGEVTTAVIEPMCELVADVPTVVDRVGLELPGWMVNERIETRFDVWIAVGMVMQQGEYTSVDALALLRAFAYGRSQTLDQIGADLVQRRLRADDLVNS